MVMVKTKNDGEVRKFPKEVLTSSNRYKHSTDLINALLEDGKEYSFDEVDNLIKKYMKGKVN